MFRVKTKAKAKMIISINKVLRSVFVIGSGPSEKKI